MASGIFPAIRRNKMPDKIDLKRQYKELFAAKAQPSLVQVPALSVVAVDGQGNPNGSQRFQDCVEALYAVSFGIKFTAKKTRGLDWGVLGLEGDWSCDDIGGFSMDRREWYWTLLIAQPDFITQAELDQAIEVASAKRGSSPALADLRFERRPAEQAAHILHLGSYDCEGPTVMRLHEFIAESGLRMTGRHREIYLSDARRVEPEKLRTIIRQPVRAL
jgi:hypothetical protein